MNAAHLFLLSSILICPSVAYSQIEAEGEHLHIGAPFDYKNYDFTINGYGQINWSNPKTNSLRLSIDLQSDHRVVIGSSSHRTELYNPESQKYMITRSSWIWTNKQPPRYDPDDLMPYGMAMNVISNVKPVKISDADTDNEYYSLDLSDLDDDCKILLNIDSEENSESLSPMTLLPFAISAMKQMNLKVEDNGRELETLSSTLKEKGLLETQFISNLFYDKFTETMTLSYSIPVNGEAFLSDNLGNLIESVACFRQDHEIVFDMSNLAKGTYIAGISVNGLSKNFRQFVKN